MAYVKQTWVDNDPNRPLSAARMSRLETQYDEAVADAASGATTIANQAANSAAASAVTTAAQNTDAKIGLGSVAGLVRNISYLSNALGARWSNS